MFFGVGFGGGNVANAVFPYIHRMKGTHNMLLTILAQLGLFGLGVYIVGFTNIVSFFIKSFRHHILMLIPIIMILTAFGNGIGEDIFTGINAGKTRHIGFELMLKRRILWLQSFPGRLSLNTSYTWSDNRFIDFTDNEKVFDTNKLPGIPKHLINTNLIWQPTSRLDLNANFQFVGEQFIDDANSQLNESYFLINIRANHRIPTTKSYYFELFAGINNLNNSRFSPMLTVNAVSFGNAEPRYYYPGLPRHFYTGIRFYIK